MVLGKGIIVSQGAWQCIVGPNKGCHWSATADRDLPDNSDEPFLAHPSVRTIAYTRDTVHGSHSEESGDTNDTTDERSRPKQCRYGIDIAETEDTHTKKCIEDEKARGQVSIDA